MVADEPVIKGFKLRLETRTSRTTRRDYDFEKPTPATRSGTTNLMFRATNPTSKTTTTPAASLDRARGKFLSQRALERHRSRLPARRRPWPRDRP